MYEVVGEALMATLRAHAGPAFTPAAEEAWAQAYRAVSSLMITAAEHDSETSPPFWTAEVVSNEERRPGISILTVAPDQPLPMRRASTSACRRRAGRRSGGRTRSLAGHVRPCGCWAELACRASGSTTTMRCSPKVSSQRCTGRAARRSRSGAVARGRPCARG